MLAFPEMKWCKTGPIDEKLADRMNNKNTNNTGATFHRKAAQSQPIRATVFRHGSRLIAGLAFIKSLNWYEMPNRRITTCFIGIHDV